ncbi:ATP-binding protein [Gracilimonas sp. BCB1]|uniref:sensor histidine kinase n=1 Tax=Gracilimonas sp. BCB1 TaxID=3152362 RepID=UPI003F87E11A
MGEAFISQWETPEINSTVKIDEIVYINTRKGQFQLEDGEIVRSQYDPLFRDFEDILTVTKKDSTLYILGFNWLAKIEQEQFNLLSENLGIQNHSVYNRHSLIVDHRDRIFYSSSSKVMQFSRQTGRSSPLEVGGRTNNIHSNRLYLDKENNVWSVDNRGLFKFNILNFKSYNRDSGLAENEVTAILESSDVTLYLANSSYLNVLKDGVVTRKYSLKSNNEEQARVLQITEHADGSIYLAAGAAGLYRLKDGQLVRMIEGNPQQNITSVISFKGSIYFSDMKFIYKMGQNSEYENVNKEPFQYIRNIQGLGDEIAFLSGTKGVYILGNGEIKNYTSEYINYNNIYDAVYWNDHLILGTAAGLARLDGERIIPFQVSDFDDLAFSLLVDKNDQLWIGTFNGVFKWDGQALEQFSVAQGLIGNEINRNALIQDKEGNIWIGTELGVSAYDEDEDMTEQKVPDLYLTSVKTENGNELISDSLAELSASNNTLTFNFKGISFLYNDRIFYRYRLSGLEGEWNFSNNFSDPGATYRNLDSGDYTFEVQARNEVSDWSEIREYSFIIAKPFYITWWFFLIVAILIAAILYAALRLRYLYLITKQKKLREMVDERTKSITRKNEQIKSKNEELIQVNKELHEKTDSLNTTLKKLETAQVKLIQKEKMAALGVLTAGVAHEINNPVNYIKSASEIIGQMMEEEDDKLVIKEKDVFEEVFKTIEIGVGRIVSIVRSLSSFSRTNETDKGDCDVNNIIDECLLILKNEYKGRVEITKDYSEKAVTIQGNAGKLYQLFTNIIMNAIQAIEGEGTVNIKTRANKEGIYIEVKDSGKGFNELVKEKLFDPFFTTKDPGKGTGLGLSIAYNIVEEHNGEIHYDSTPGKGTIVTIKFSEK